MWGTVRLRGTAPPREPTDPTEPWLCCCTYCAEYPKRLRKLLLTPEREVAVELALLRDNGEVWISAALWSLLADEGLTC